MNTPGQPAAPAVNAGPQAKDFTIDLKVNSKQCFDSYGCNVVVQPKVTYAGNLASLEGESCQITYTISGDQSGAIIDTVNSTGSNFLAMPTVLTVDKSSTPITAAVTTVDCT